MRHASLTALVMVLVLAAACATGVSGAGTALAHVDASGLDVTRQDRVGGAWLAGEGAGDAGLTHPAPQSLTWQDTIATGWTAPHPSSQLMLLLGLAGIPAGAGLILARRLWR